MNMFSRVKGVVLLASSSYYNVLYEGPPVNPPFSAVSTIQVTVAEAALMNLLGPLI
jgi:hypothetical protein